ncbi:MAG: acyloxyacyl hydrolase [Flavobacteriaceae bacterium]|jgi:hypothetical protein|nr:hypothetical protein [Flavobacteriaceae bacterium]|tara:strand:- start:5782 stop:7080 length:1299 start_codon:yes stop_codon:yes gene_type:complete
MMISIKKGRLNSMLGCIFLCITYVKSLFLFLGFIIVSQTITAQEENNRRLRSQLSPFLSKSYFSFNFGGIYYPYSNENLKEGYTSSGTKMNAFSGRLLLGYKLSNNTALQFGVIRPASWFSFKDIEYKGQESSVWVNAWTISLKQNINVFKKTDFFIELGVANNSRVGIYNNDTPIYESVRYISSVLGTGIQYRLNEKWDLMLMTTYLPESISNNQPYTLQSTFGAKYNLKQVPKNLAEKYLSDKSYFFPKQFVNIGYGSGNLGFFTNRFFSAKAKAGNYESLGIPIFWHGDLEAKSVFSLTYQRTAFRTKRYFSLDWGASFTFFNTPKKSSLYALSIFPVLRFYLFRTKGVDFYTNYSVIGPTYISKSTIDGIKTGTEFTYQDFMGVGAFFGSSKQYNLDVKIMHYSNGNIFTQNAGVAIPLVFSFGYTLP